MDGLLLTVADTAKLLSLSDYTVRKLAIKGILRGIKIGTGAGQWRFRMKDIDEYIRSADMEQQEKNE
jgi:excisionase family DNA binding protein